jgi:hypothetical protein
VPQHDRQRDQAHRDDRCGDNAGRRGKQRADADHRIGHTAADGAEKLPGGIEQLLRHARSFEDQPHEGEKRDREQRLVRHDAPDPVGQRLKERRVEEVELNAEDSEAQPNEGEREGHRVADEQEDDERREHDRRHIVDEEPDHAAALLDWNLMGRVIRRRIGDDLTQDRDPFDQLRDRLEEQEDEADEDGETPGPNHQTTGAAGHLTGSK